MGFPEQEPALLFLHIIKRIIIFSAMIFLSELVCQCRGLGNALSLVDIADRKDTGNKNFTNNRPLVQRGSALKGDANTVEYGGVVFLAAADQSALFAEELILLAADYKTEHLVDHSFDLRRDRVPIDRAGEHKGVGGEDVVRNGVEIIVEGAGFSGLVAGLAAMTEIQLQLGGIDDLYFVSLCCGCLSECLSHPVAVAAFPGASGKNQDLFGHGVFPPVNSDQELTSYAGYGIIKKKK